MTLQRIKSSEINRNKWDNCIQESFNSSVCAYSWYLDAVCADWEAIVEDDYAAVLPLPVQKLGGIKYVANPKFLPMLSIYARTMPSEARISLFFQAIPYVNIKLCLVPYNGMPHLQECADSNSSLVFDLILGFQFLRNTFQSYFRLEMYSVFDGLFTVVRTQNLNDYLTFRKLYIKGSTEELRALRRLMGFCLRFKSIGIYAAYNLQNMPVAMMVLIKQESRMTVVDVVVDVDKQGDVAYYYMLLHVLRNHAESNQVLSFPVKYLYLNSLAEKIRVNGVQYKRGVVRFF